MSDVCGGKIWLVNARKYGVPVNRNFTDIIAEYDGLYQELTRTVRGTRKTGIAIPLHKRFLKWHPLHPNATDEFFLEPNSWGERLLGIYGIPYYGTFDLTEDSIYALAGANSIRRFTDDEIRTLLKGKVIIDGAAAVELCKRGFAELLGVNATYRDMKYRFEYNDITGTRYPISKQGEFPALEVLDKNVRVMSSFYYAAFASSTEREKVAPATTVYKNSLGGTVGVTAISVADIYYWNIWVDVRKDWMTDFLDMVNGSKIPNVVLAYQNIVTLSRKAKDGSEILAIFNQNFDPLKKIVIRRSTPVKKLQILTPAGKWQELPVNLRDGNLTVEHPLECYRFLVLKVN
jgi:hypothetical protein